MIEKAFINVVHTQARNFQRHCGWIAAQFGEIVVKIKCKTLF